MLQVWRKIRLGVRKSPEAYAASLRQRGVQIVPAAAAALLKVPCAQTEEEVELVVARSTQVGFMGKATVRALGRSVGRFGLGKCPAETALVLCEEYLGQLPGGRLIVFMDPIMDSRESPCLFGLDDKGAGIRLYASGGHPDNMYDSSYLLVFTSHRLTEPVGKSPRCTRTA